MAHWRAPLGAGGEAVNLDAWYRGRRVLVTGHTGFKGSWLSAWLASAGAEVTGYALSPEAGRPSLFESGRVAELLHSVTGNVTDLEHLERTAIAASPEVIFHLAAQSLVRRSYHQPVDTFATNVMGTVHLLDVVRRLPSVRAVVIVTSDKCYENDGSGVPLDETHRMGGHDPYSASKGCTELVTAAYRASYFRDAGPAVASARAGNEIGGGDWAADRLVPDLVRAAIRGEAAPVRHPGSTRPWQYVLEPLRGYLMLGRALTEEGAPYAEGWNFGPRPEDAVTVRDVVRLMRGTWDRVSIREEPSDGLPEAGLLSLDCRKSAGRLGWRPTMSIAGAIERTTAWYRGWHDDPAQAPSLLQHELDRYRADTLTAE